MDAEITVTENFDLLGEMVKESLAVGLNAAAIHAQSKARQNMGSEGGGGGKPAPEGKFPAVQTGVFRNSIVTTNATGDEPVVTLGTSDKRGEWFEFGYVAKSPTGKLTAVPARPWLRRTMNEEAGKLESIAGKAASRFISNASKYFGVK